MVTSVTVDRWAVDVLFLMGKVPICHSSVNDECPRFSDKVVTPDQVEWVDDDYHCLKEVVLIVGQLQLLISDNNFLNLE